MECLAPLGDVATSAFLIYLKIRKSSALMDEGQRRSNRLVKICNNPSFLYDKEYIKLLEDSGSRGEERQHRLSLKPSISDGTRPIPSDISQQVATTSFGKSVANESLEDCSDIYFMPFTSNCVQDNTQQVKTNSPIKLRRSFSQQLKNEPEERRQDGGSSSVNKNSESSRQESTIFRRNSSSRLDFLSFDSHILSVSSSVCTDMSGNEDNSLPVVERRRIVSPVS